ncbi:MAG: uridine kinase [Nocardioides sp.]|nr:uridine kinase [Nocardioides sp.]
MRLSTSSVQRPVPSRPDGARGVHLQRLADVVDAVGPRRLVVAVDGPAGSGKTTFGHELGLALRGCGRTVLRASLDDFRRPVAEWVTAESDGGVAMYRHALDVTRLQHDLVDPLRRGDPVALCGLDPLTQEERRDVRVVPARFDVLLVDGLFAQQPAVRGLWDLAIWLQVRPEVVERRSPLARRLSLAEELYRTEVDPARTADLVVDYSATAALRVAHA